MLKKRITIILVHIGGWVLFLMVPMFLLPSFEEIGQEPPMPGRIFLLGGFFAMIAFFYLNYHVFIPRVLVRHGRWPYFILVVFFLVAMVFLHTNLRSHFMEGFNPFGAYTIVFERLGRVGFSAFFLTVWVVSSGLWVLSEWRKSEERLRASEHERVTAELSQLKSQMNPHFLFNTLNGIYALTLTNDSRASKAVLKLSSLLSYVLTESSGDFVPLEKDINHLLHFVELNKLRLSEKTTIEMEVSGTTEGQVIAPLLLLPFVENAFKYGVSSAEESNIEIKIEIRDGHLSFYCFNKVFKNLNPQWQSGVGVANTQRRLELMYPDRHRLDIQEIDGTYEVFLTIVLAGNQSLSENTGFLNAKHHPAI